PIYNGGVGCGARLGVISPTRTDLLITTTLPSLPIFSGVARALLPPAGAEHGNALVVNTASIAGKQGQPWLSVYSATKSGVIGFTEAMNAELGGLGIKSTALCPAWVDTPMTDFVKGRVPPEAMIQTSDIVASVRMLLSLSPGCVVPEIVFRSPTGGALDLG
ncbi:MAG: SDR family oxidoreductase, partial [Actinobacteria bacterium]|nr:SDR family oxidoreductase [Actinomycetota bacterium]